MRRHTYESAGVTYDVEALWRLTAAHHVHDFPVSILKPQLEQPSWSEGDARLRPVEVMRSPASHPEHAARIEAAKDSEHPILIDTDCAVVDGLHRLAHAVSWGHEFIRARIVSGDTMRQAVVPSRPVVHKLELYGLKNASVSWARDVGAIISCDGAGVSYVYGDGCLAVRNEPFGQGRDARLSASFELVVRDVGLFGTSFCGIAVEATDPATLTVRIDATSELLKLCEPPGSHPNVKISAYNGCAIAGPLFGMYRDAAVEMHGGQVVRVVGARAPIPRLEIGAPMLPIPALLPSPPVFRLADAPKPEAAFPMPPTLPCEKAEDGAEDQCKVCLDNRADCGLGGCAHRLCFKCLGEQRKHGLATCPFCRTKITRPKRLLAPRRKIVKK